MPHGPHISRRRLLKTLFCSSAAMGLNLRAQETPAAAPDHLLDLLALGDFGTGDKAQKDLGLVMAGYAAAMKNKAQGMLLLGDNFYHPMPGGYQAPRWKTDFSDVYPASVFPGPCWAILGNHDYHDTPGNEHIQLGYPAFRNHKTRWTMPAKHYRLDLPAVNPMVTFLMIDTNWESINRRIHGGSFNCWMSADEKAEQAIWLESQLASKRAPFTVVVGHHPIYSDGAHSDTPELVQELGPVLEKHGVHLYLCGHDHDLQHLELEGLKTSFVISGGGGAPLCMNTKARQNSVIKPTHGFSHLFVAEKRLHVRHIDSTGQACHAFSKGIGHDWRVES
ncbi:MAG: metallophosphoesterase [Luteolibacter sp.]